MQLETIIGWQLSGDQRFERFEVALSFRFRLKMPCERFNARMFERVALTADLAHQLDRADVVRLLGKYHAGALAALPGLNMTQHGVASFSLVRISCCRHPQLSFAPLGSMQTFSGASGADVAGLSGDRPPGGAALMSTGKLLALVAAASDAINSVDSGARRYSR